MRIMMTTTKWAALAVMAFAICSSSAFASEYRLPDNTEMQAFTPEAQQFYAAGLAAIDRADYVNAYNMLAKAAQLQPGAVRLNGLAAGLAIKHGRSAAASPARDYYETAIVSYRSILAQPHLAPSDRRHYQNQLKIALDEQANLALRDAKREAIGWEFVQDLNKEYSKPTPGPGEGREPGSVAPPAIPAAGGNPLANPGLALQPGMATIPTQPLNPGANIPMDPTGIPMPPYPGPGPQAPNDPSVPGPAPVPGSAPPPAFDPNAPI